MANLVPLDPNMRASKESLMMHRIEPLDDARKTQQVVAQSAVASQLASYREKRAEQQLKERNNHHSPERTAVDQTNASQEFYSLVNESKDFKQNQLNDSQQNVQQDEGWLLKKDE